jgi:hypothetical protein
MYVYMYLFIYKKSKKKKTKFEIEKKNINESLEPFGRYWPMGLSPAFPLPLNDMWAFFLYFFLYDT